jgi:hypothetical protein
MKERPNISIQQKSNKKLEYLKYLATENIQPNIIAPTYVVPKGKTKYKPKVNVQKGIDINKVNQFRIDMINYAINEKGINPDLLVEYNDKYILTITSYELITNNETPTTKDFDIYCNGLKVDLSTYSVNVGREIVIIIQKSEAVDDNFDENNFEIVSRFTLAYMINDSGDYLITDGLDDIII